MKHFILTIVFIIMLSYSGFSQSIVTDRPDQTESALSVPVGSFQIETGMSLMYFSESGNSYRSFSGPSSLFRFGIIKGIELRVTNQFESLKNLDNEDDFSGMIDMMAGVKVELLNRENTNTKIALLSHLVIPTGSQDLTLNNYGTVNRLAFSHDLTDKLGLGYNIGYDYFSKGSGIMVGTLALGYSVTDKLGLFVEGYGNYIDFEDTYLNYDAGFTYLIKNNLQFDFSFASGINHYMNFISTGISWNIGGY